MCVILRYDEDIEGVTGTFKKISHIHIAPKVRFRVAPSEPVPVLTLNPDGAAQVDMMNFGFRTGKGRQMMARGETVSELRMFKEAFQRRRCLVLARGFYDCEGITKKILQPWHFHRKGDAWMCFAALWETGPDANSFTIVSCPSNTVVGRVNDRMPVILTPDTWPTWLDPQADADKQLKPLLQTYPSEDMEAWPVTRKVNSKGFDSPECIARLPEEQGDLGMF